MTPLPPSTAEGLLQMIEQHHDTAEEAHKRLRETLRDQHDTIESNFRHFETETNLLRAQVAAIALQAATPVDATRLMLTTKAILAVVAAAVTIVASYWNLSAKIDNQQRVAESAQQLQAVQLKALGDLAADAKATAADAKRQYELLRYDFQDLKNAVQKQGK